MTDPGRVNRAQMPSGTPEFRFEPGPTGLTVEMTRMALQIGIKPVLRVNGYPLPQAGGARTRCRGPRGSTR